MKTIKMRSIIIILLAISWVAVGIAQEATSPKTSVLDAKQIDVRDSSGKQMKFEEWSRLVVSGKYELKVNQAGNGGTLQKVPDSLYKKKMMSMPYPGESSSFVTGTVPESFSTRTIAGKKVDLGRLKGKVVVLNFWFVNCPPCRQEIPELNQLTREFANKEVVFLGIALDDQAQLEEFIKGIPFDYQLIASGSSIASQYGVRAYPTHAVLGKDGKVVFQTKGLGPTTLFWLKESIEKALVTP
jgi:peroxiredoxin